ncbi:MAG: hypothetical protein JW730_21645 [Anaerolineales bacterium]|nr:hypothetical protein [Anaerolineales bacterium]
MKKKKVAQAVRLAGFFFSLIALLFVGKSFWDQRKFLLGIDLRSVAIIAIACSLLYLLANLILVIAWKMLLHWFGEAQLSLIDGIRTYGQAQILKYIPGNIFSLPGRHLLSIQQGIEHGPLIGAAMFEIIGLLTTSSAVSILGILLNRGNVMRLSLLGAFIVFLLALASPFAIRYMLSREFVLKKLPVFQLMNWGDYSHLMGIWLLYFCFFMLTGLILFWITSAMQGSWGIAPWTVISSTFAVSWLLGFVTPGSPAGVGVREGIIILILSNYLGEPASVVISLIMRVITMTGDVLFYFCGLFLRGKDSMRFHPVR